VVVVVGAAVACRLVEGVVDVDELLLVPAPVLVVVVTAAVVLSALVPV
jgi:hypothetical protein